MRDVLPRYQSCSPRVLESAELERETGNVKSRIVRGDGIEIKTEKSAYDEFTTDGIADSEDRALANGMDPAEMEAEDLGWKRTTEAARDPSYSTSPQARDGTSIDMDTHPAVPQSPPLRTKSDNTLRSVQYLSLSPQQTPPRRQKAFTIGHSHTRSLTEQQHAHSSTIGRWHPFSMSVTENVTAPAPTVRSSHRAISHPDMAELCREWAEGPANQTTTYRPGNPTP